MGMPEYGMAIVNKRGISVESSTPMPGSQSAPAPKQPKGMLLQVLARPVSKHPTVMQQHAIHIPDAKAQILFWTVVPSFVLWILDILLPASVSEFGS